MKEKVWGDISVFLSGATSPGASSKPPYLLKYRSSTFFIILTVCLAIFTDIFYYGLIVPVIPYSLTVQVGVPEDELQQWTAILLACYNVALFIGSPIAGLYADHTSSRRWPLLIGLVALAGSTLMLCLGKVIGLLIVGRILQGFSAAVAWSVCLALLADTMGRNIGLSMGYVSIAMSVGLLIAPVIGGAVYAAEGYYPVYYVAFGVVVCDIIFRLVLIEKKVARQWITEDEAPSAGDGAAAPRHADATSTPDGSAEIQEMRGREKDTAVIQGPDTSTTKGTAEQSVPVGEAAKYPHWELLKMRRIQGSLVGIVIQSGGMFALDTVVPLFVKDTFHWGSTAAGLVFICVMIPGFFSPVVGSWADKYGTKWPATVGFLSCVPLLVCLRFVTENSVGHKVLLCALLVLIGIAFTISNTPLMAEISYAIDAKETECPGIWGEKGVYGIGYGFFNTSFALGGAIGSLMAGYLVAGPGWGTMTWVMGLWFAVGAVFVSFLVGGKPAGPTGDLAASTSESVPKHAV